MKLAGPHVKPVGLHPKFVEGAFKVAPIVLRHLGYVMSFTSLNDGQHMRSSPHYTGRAGDIRTWESESNPAQISLERRMELRGAMARALGADFDVIAEDDHIHFEYDPQHATGD